MNLILNFILNPWLYFILAIIIGARLYQKGKVVFQEGYLFSITSTIMAMLYWICFLFLLNSLNLDLEFIILVAPFLVYLILSFF